jgi:hypothetical protein
MKKIYIAAFVTVVSFLNESSAGWCRGKSPSQCTTENEAAEYLGSSCLLKDKCRAILKKAQQQRDYLNVPEGTGLAGETQARANAFLKFLNENSTELKANPKAREQLLMVQGYINFILNSQQPR